MNTAINNDFLTDFHAHCLPDVDDGAATLDMAVTMLRSSAQQGVKRVVATPHFYIGQHSATGFFKERQRAYDQLRPYLTGDMPQVVLGAEVLIREGISRYDLHPFCIEGTDILLVEMPFMAPPYWLTEELEGLVNDQGLTLMFAHLDRYLSWYSTAHFEMLLDMPGSIMQINADSVADKRYFNTLLRRLPAARRMVLGSDMHDTKYRPSCMAQAIKTMSKSREGRDWLSRIMWTTEYLETQTDDVEGLL